MTQYSTTDGTIPPAHRFLSFSRLGGAEHAISGIRMEWFGFVGVGVGWVGGSGVQLA